MRYENWDVLLFPDGLKGPIQEFRTQCFVTKDLDSPYLKYGSTFGPAYFPQQGNVGQLPVLTTFIPSVPKDTPIRVSIHSWEKPRPSRLIESIMQPDDVLLYEARVFVDGDCVAGGIFSQRAHWPYIIDLSSRTEIDRDGNQDRLRFPAFHPDILEQRHWDAGDPYGRIKVVLAEGFSRPNRSPPFERVKDVVALSFQHAPLNILEYSSISWPNPNMWLRPRATFKYGTEPTSYEKDPEAHASGHGHTPTKESRVLQPVQGQANRAPPPPLLFANWATNSALPMSTSGFSHWPVYPNDSHWDIGNQENDTFMAEAATAAAAAAAVASSAWQQRGARSSREDVPMLDYSSSSSRAISSITGMSFEHSKQPSMTTPMDDEQYNQLIQSMTPTKAPSTIVKGRKEKVPVIEKQTEKGSGKKAEKQIDKTIEKQTKEPEVDVVEADVEIELQKDSEKVEGAQKAIVV